MGGQRRLGDLLVEMKFINEGQLQLALEEQRKSGRRLGRILCESGQINEARLVRALSMQLGLDICSPLTGSLDQEMKALLPIELVTRFHVMPVSLIKEANNPSQTLVVATADPLDSAALLAIRAHAGDVRVRWVLAPETELDLALARHYNDEPTTGTTTHPPSHYPPKDLRTRGTPDIRISADLIPPLPAGKRTADIAAASSWADAIAVNNESLDVPIMELEPADEVMFSTSIDADADEGPDLVDMLDSEAELAPPLLPLAPEPQRAEQIRQQLLDFVRGKPQDLESTHIILRAIVALLLNEGWLDGQRLERALDFLSTKVG